MQRTGRMGVCSRVGRCEWRGEEEDARVMAYTWGRASPIIDHRRLSTVQVMTRLGLNASLLFFNTARSTRMDIYADHMLKYR